MDNLTEEQKQTILEALEREHEHRCESGEEDNVGEIEDIMDLIEPGYSEPFKGE